MVLVHRWKASSSVKWVLVVVALVVVVVIVMVVVVVVVLVVVVVVPDCSERSRYTADWNLEHAPGQHLF